MPVKSGQQHQQELLNQEDLQAWLPGGNVPRNATFPAGTASFALWQDMEPQAGLEGLSKPGVTTWALFPDPA